MVRPHLLALGQSVRIIRASLLPQYFQSYNMRPACFRSAVVTDWLDSCDPCTPSIQDDFTCTGSIVRLPPWQINTLRNTSKIARYWTTPLHSKMARVFIHNEAYYINTTHLLGLEVSTISHRQQRRILIDEHEEHILEPAYQNNERKGQQ